MIGSDEAMSGLGYVWNNGREEDMSLEIESLNRNRMERMKSVNGKSKREE